MVEQPRSQVSEMHFDKFPNPSTFQCWKTSFKTDVCSCSGFPSEAMHWIKEVEMVESVDDLKSSRSIKGYRFPNFLRCFLQRLLVLWRRSSRTLTSRRESIWRSKRCKYSHIPMTVNQELLSNTKHVQEQKGAITLTLIAPPRDIDKTTLQQP